MRTSRKQLAAVAVSALLYSVPALADDPFANVPGCTSPTLLTQAYAQGAQNGYQTVQSTFTRPQSVLNLSCLSSLLNSGNFDVMFNLNTLVQALLNMAAQQVCQAAESVWSSGGMSSFSPSTLFAQTPLGTIPGLTTGSGSLSSSGVTPLNPSGVGVVTPRMPAGVGSNPAGNGSNSNSLGSLFQ